MCGFGKPQTLSIKLCVWSVGVFPGREAGTAFITLSKAWPPWWGRVEEGSPAPARFCCPGFLTGKVKAEQSP